MKQFAICLLSMIFLSGSYVYAQCGEGSCSTQSFQCSADPSDCADCLCTPEDNCGCMLELKCNCVDCQCTPESNCGCVVQFSCDCAECQDTPEFNCGCFRVISNASAESCDSNNCACKFN